MPDLSNQQGSFKRVRGHLLTSTRSRLRDAFTTPTYRDCLSRRHQADKLAEYHNLTGNNTRRGILLWVADVRYELALPHEYSIFTFIPGDVDFNPKKPIPPAESRHVNYMTIEATSTASLSSRETVR
jgi:hypothetical protein